MTKWTQLLLVSIVVLGLSSAVQGVSAKKKDKEPEVCQVIEDEVYDFADAIEVYIEGCDIIEFVNITVPIKFDEKIDIINKSITFNTTEGNSTVLAYCPPKKKHVTADYFFYINDAPYVLFENINFTTCGRTEQPYFYVKESFLEFKHCNVSDNISNEDSGAILCEEADVLIYNSTFLHNTGVEGGVLELQSNCTVTANETNFISNTAHKGSVAHISDCYNTIDFFDCTFLDNVGKDTQDHVFIVYKKGYKSNDQECPNDVIISP